MRRGGWSEGVACGLLKEFSERLESLTGPEMFPRLEADTEEETWPSWVAQLVEYCPVCQKNKKEEGCEFSFQLGYIPGFQV